MYHIILKLASKTKCYDSIMMNLSLQNDSNLKNIEDSLSSAIKSKNELLINLLKKIPLEDNWDQKAFVKLHKLQNKPDLICNLLVLVVSDFS